VQIVFPSIETIAKLDIFSPSQVSSLRWLFNRFSELASSGSTNIPKLVLIDNGIHDEGGNYIVINIPISIVGESREHCVVIGGLKMYGKIEDDVNVQDLTLCESKYAGVDGYNSASFHLDNVSIENSGSRGVFVSGSQRNTMKNCNVSHSKWSGLVVGSGGSITIDGNATTVHHNGVCGGWVYGMYTYHSSSSILLVSPLTKEMISTNNDGGRNYGGQGTIQTITNNIIKDEKK